MAVLRDLIVGLTRAGCRVERVEHAGPSVVFRTGGDDRLRLSSRSGYLELTGLSEGDQRVLGRYGAVDEALRAVGDAHAVGTAPADR